MKLAASSEPEKNLPAVGAKRRKPGEALENKVGRQQCVKYSIGKPPSGFARVEPHTRQQENEAVPKVAQPPEYMKCWNSIIATTPNP